MASPAGHSRPAASGDVGRTGPETFMVRRKLEGSLYDGGAPTLQATGRGRSAINQPPPALKRLMLKSKLGVKRLCQACGSRFYDLGKRPVVCPRCGAEVDLQRLKRTHATKSAAPDPSAAAAPARRRSSAPPAPRAAANGRANRRRRSTRSGAGSKRANRRCSACSATPASARRRSPAISPNRRRRDRLRRLHRQGGAGDALEGLRRRDDHPCADLPRERGRGRRAELHPQPRRAGFARRR